MVSGSRRELVGQVPSPKPILGRVALSQNGQAVSFTVVDDGTPPPELKKGQAAKNSVDKFSLNRNSSTRKQIRRTTQYASSALTCSHNLPYYYGRAPVLGGQQLPRYMFTGGPGGQQLPPLCQCRCCTSACPDDPNPVTQCAIVHFM